MQNMKITPIDEDLFIDENQYFEGAS